MTAPTSPGVVPADVRMLAREHANRSFDDPLSPIATQIERAVMADRAIRPSLTEDESERRKAMDEVAPILESHDGFPEWAMIHFPTGAVRVLCGLSRWPYAMHKARRALADRSEPRQEKEGDRV